MADGLLIYGAYGYTGQLIVNEALKAGLQPVLAGRSAEKLHSYAAAQGLEERVFGLESAEEVDAGLAGMQTVIHCAGPFNQTAEAMARGCIRNGVHYLDITGEIGVFEALATMDDAAKAAGVMLMPGTGFDVVPSDCLALHLKEKLPSAISLTLAFHSGGGMSHGTATTIVEDICEDGQIRKEGVITAVPGAWQVRDFDFGTEEHTCMSIPWGDVSTAFYSTGIPNIVVFMSASPGLRQFVKWSRFFRPLLSNPTVIGFIKSKIPEGGPDKAMRERSTCLLWGEVRDDAGQVVRALLKTPEGYTLTAKTAFHIAQRCLAGDAPPGYQTPSMAYGSDLVLKIAGVEGFTEIDAT